MSNMETFTHEVITWINGINNHKKINLKFPSNHTKVNLSEYYLIFIIQTSNDLIKLIGRYPSIMFYN